MISLFRKKQRSNYRLHALQSVSNKVDYKLHLLADHLSKRSEHLSPKKLAFLIIAFCVLMAACFSYITITSARYKKIIEVQSICAPAIRQSPSSDDNAIVLKRITHFHKYLDSLKENNPSCYQTIVDQRPHLVDSLIQAEQFLQSKKF